MTQLAPAPILQASRMGADVGVWLETERDWDGYDRVDRSAIHAIDDAETEAAEV